MSTFKRFCSYYLHIIHVILLCLASLQVNSHSQNTSAGKIFDIPFYWQTDKTVFDTLGWNVIDDSMNVDTKCKSPQKACAIYNGSGYYIYKLEDATPMSIAILFDLKYKIIMLSQWNVFPPDKILVESKNTPNEYKNHRIMSDYVWEQISKYDFEKPTGKMNDFKLSFHFADHGFSTMKGKDELMKLFVPLESTTEHFRIDFYGGSSSSEVTKRKFFAVYVISKGVKKPSEIVNEIENKMDELKLDLSYKIPKISMLKILDK